MKNNNLLLTVAVFVLVGLVGVVIGSKALYKHAVEDISNKAAERATERVITSLRANYTPGPYTPGFDPDKVDPNLFKQQQQPPVVPNQPKWSTLEQEMAIPPARVPHLDREAWNQQWEASRF